MQVIEAQSFWSWHLTITCISTRSGRSGEGLGWRLPRSLLDYFRSEVPTLTGWMSVSVRCLTALPPVGGTCA
jgi:hypothetical protein